MKSRRAHDEVDMIDAMAARLKALGHPERLRLFQLIRSERYCCYVTSGGDRVELGSRVGDLGREFKLAPSTVSHHLKELRTAGLIEVERRGQCLFCRVREVALGEIAGLYRRSGSDGFIFPSDQTSNQGGATMTDNKTQPESLRAHIRSRYAEVAVRGATGCCEPGPSRGVAVSAASEAAAESCGAGYDPEALAGLPEGADLGLGCGNPTALAALKPGEVVLDLGSGGGIDCFLAAQAVGPTGRVIGVDMTPEMIERARRAAREGAIDNVEFRLGEIEHLPVADASVDVVISNCVINLAPDKASVFREVMRVLRPGGRVHVSDLALTAPLPEAVRSDPDAIAGCIGGALLIEEYRRTVAGAGFELEGFAVRGSQSSRHAIEGTTSPDPLVAEAVAVAGEATRLLRNVDIVARKPRKL